MPSAVRPSMGELVTRVRTLIFDPAGPSQTFSDDLLQDWLDRTRQLVRYELLTPAPDIVPPSDVRQPAQFDWATYVSRFTDWEADAVLQGIASGQAWHILSPLTSEWMAGRWTFDVTLPAISTNIPGQLPPVFIVGKVYDPYLAAAWALEAWSATDAGSFDFTSDGQSFRRSQKFGQRLKLAEVYRRSAKPTILHVYRGDFQITSAQQPVRLIGESNDFTR